MKNILYIFQFTRLGKSKNRFYISFTPLTVSRYASLGFMLSSEKMRRERLGFGFALAVLSLWCTMEVAVEAASSLQPPMKLVWHYYRVHNTCDFAEAYIKHQVESFYKNDKTIAPKLLHLLYADCFVNVSIYHFFPFSFLFVYFIFLL